jgi:phosphate transport system ATP-binding protein
VVKVSTKNLSVYFGKNCTLKSINLGLFTNEILGVIGPANSGKTTFLRTINRLNDLEPHFRMEGEILLDQVDIYKYMDVHSLRRKVGMVFALPTPLPMSVFDNVAYGPRMHGIKKKRELSDIVEGSLNAAYLWDEVKDRLNESALNLSGGQQQRLCIARTLAVQPEVILFDEPCSGLDPVSTGKVEEAMQRMKKDYTLVLVTNNTKQAARVSDRVAFFLMGELVEVDKTDTIFTAPHDGRTAMYITGRFG